MTTTYANHLAGGPKAYIAAYGTSLPSLAAATVTWANNEVQTITPSGTWTSGTYTIEFTHPTTGATETTATIAYTADASAIKAALAALGSLATGDLTVTGGPLSDSGPVKPVIVTFGGAYANTPIPALSASTTLIVGGGTAAVVRTTQGRQWTELPDVIGDCKITSVYEVTDHKPTFAPFRTGSVVTQMGLESVALTIRESDLDALYAAIPATLISTFAPGAGQVGYDYVASPLPCEVGTSYYALALAWKGPQCDTGWGIIRQVYRVKRNFGEDFSSGDDVREINLVFDAFADDANSYRTHKDYEYKLAATS
jgi:hypothetical protein